MSVPLLSFFTGGGFLDLGFEEVGFHIVWTNEVNPTFARMYAHGMTTWRRCNHRNAPPASISCQQSIEQLSAGIVIREAFPKGRPTWFGIIGGPPCTDFSRGGRNSGSNGHHGQLSIVYTNLVCKLKPSFFLLENVPGLSKTKKHVPFFNSLIKQYEKAGYAVDFRVLNALEYGVPQDRDRLFIIGIRRGYAKSLQDYSIHNGQRDWFIWPKPLYPNAKKLPWPTIVQTGRSPELPAGVPMTLTVNSVLAEPNNPSLLPNGNEYFQPYSKRFQTQAEGDVHTKSFKRLHRFRFSPTAWYGNNEVHLHPWEPRRLSVREALRIQSVPDTYVLPTDEPLSAKFKLICNGVPCTLAVTLARAIFEFIQPLLDGQYPLYRR